MSVESDVLLTYIQLNYRDYTLNYLGVGSQTFAEHSVTFYILRRSFTRQLSDLSDLVLSFKSR